MIPAIYHTSWTGPKEMPEQYRKMMRQNWLELDNVFWEHKHWTEKNLGEFEFDKWKLPVPASTSNIVRLFALYYYGGVWMDTDVQVLKPFDELLINKAFIAKQPDGVYCNAVMGATPKHPWIEWMLKKAVKEQKNNDAAWACHLVKDSPMEDVTVLPTDYFYSWNFDEKPKEASPNAYALHWWEGSWLK